MSVIKTTGSISGLIATNPNDFTTADAVAETYCVDTFRDAYQDIWSGNFSVSSFSNTFLSGHPWSTGGNVSLSGTGFLGHSGSISHIDYSDGAGHWTLDGALLWNDTLGIYGGSVTHIEAWTGANGVSMTGSMQVTSVGLVGTLTSFDVFAHGLTIEYGGSVHVSGASGITSGTITSVNIHDGAGDSIHLTGSYAVSTFDSAVNGATSIDHALNSPTLLSGNDTFIVPDASRLWHGYSGNDNIIGGALIDRLYGDAGNDKLTGLAGADLLAGGAGNDTLRGGTGNDQLYGGIGSDTFLFEKTATFNGVDRIMDFKAIDGDKLDLSLMLSATHPLQAAIDNFIHATASGSNTVLSVDAGGTGVASHFHTVATLVGVTGVDIHDLFSHGNLVT